MTQDSDDLIKFKKRLLAWILRQLTVRAEKTGGYARGQRVILTALRQFILKDK